MTKTPHLHAKAKRPPTTHLYAPPRSLIPKTYLYIYIPKHHKNPPPPPPPFFLNLHHPPTTSPQPIPPHTSKPQHTKPSTHITVRQTTLCPTSPTPQIHLPKPLLRLLTFLRLWGLCNSPNQSINQSPWSNPADGMISVCCMEPFLEPFLHGGREGEVWGLVVGVKEVMLGLKKRGR